jgi:hypothetical protein
MQLYRSEGCSATLRRTTNLILTLILAAVALPGQSGSYNLITLGQANGLDSFGNIVGSACCYNGWYLTPSGASSTLNFPGASYTSANGINDAGEIVGVAQVSGATIGFYLNGGLPTEVVYTGGAPTWALGVNNSGQIVGQYLLPDSTAHGYLFTPPASFSPLDVPNAVGTVASGINDYGDIVGQYVDQAGVGHGFYLSHLSKGKFKTIDYPGATGTAVIGINNNGQMVGQYINGGEHSFLLDASFFLNIDPPFNCIGDNFATGINDGGEIVGYASVCGNANGYSRQGPANWSVLTFPLKGNSPTSGDLHYTSATAPVNSIFDHSMNNTVGDYGIYTDGCDDVVMAFTGTVAQYNPSTVHGCMSSYTLNQTTPYTPITPLLKPMMKYRGAGNDNTYLNYDSHPGIDYQAGLKTPVYAAVSGTVHYPPRIIGLKVGKTPAQGYHVMEIIPDYQAGLLPPYVVYYLHLDTYPCPVSSSKVPCQTVGSVTATDPDPLPECQGSAGYNGSSVALPLQDGARVTAGCAAALSGWAGLSEPKQAHLHFEVQTIVPASAVSTQAGAQQYAACVDPNITAIVGKTGYDCLPVDPYGWTGTPVQCTNQATSGDPYWCLTGIQNVPLWK